MNHIQYHSISDIQDYFEYILKKDSGNVDDPSIKTYVNKVENRVTFKIKNYNLKITISQIHLILK